MFIVRYDIKQPGNEKIERHLNSYAYFEIDDDSAFFVDNSFESTMSYSIKEIYNLSINGVPYIVNGKWLEEQQ